ncbi:glutamyl-tRNA reductase [Winogradskya consettensis]|uniref:Glutamyl-tRNA reductase n=1 Tax=Winogradskya consettensis TaxID=113560 RepID=A0A919SB10_9ACTN|nr:glutamyl-tRNA reductase [Actinoplanes consettensis]GIM68303.1 glutamyl-tRNA reductase [Actinoplanes consettensis]
MSAQRSSENPVNLVVVGLSHASAPVDLLEQLSLPDDRADALLQAARTEADAAGAMLLATCGRIELYAELEAGAAADRLPRLLAEQSGQPLDKLRPYLYVHTAERTVEHLFSVASGLDSVVIGEEQILGQVKGALERARGAGASGQALHQMVQTALRTGKQVRTRTGLNKAGRDLATVGIARFEQHVGSLAGRHALIIGAGSMAAVVAAALRRAGVERFDVANRSPERAQHLADTAGGRGAGLAEIPELLPAADVVVTCAGGTDIVLSTSIVAGAMADRADRPLFVLDLALPRNVDAAVADLPGVRVVDLRTLTDAEPDIESAASVEAAEKLVTAAVEEFMVTQRTARVGPVLAAMRTAADTALTAELSRLTRRVPSLDEHAHSEIARALHRVVDKLLHQPTVRARQLAGRPQGDVYLGVLGELFAPADTAPDPGENKNEVLV